MAAHYNSSVQVYSFDGLDTPASTVAALRAKGGLPICYFSAGSFEDWRPDAGSFLAADKGLALDGWPGERWLDIRSSNVKKIMRKRMEVCRSKGFVGVDPDNVDGYSNKNGLGLTAADQLAYNAWLAATAHDMGLAVGLKNDLAQVNTLAPLFDFFVNEQCMFFNECNLYAPAKAADKPVWNVEYDPAAFRAACIRQAEFGISSIHKDRDLKLFRYECPSSTPAGTTPRGTGPSLAPPLEPPRVPVTTPQRPAAAPGPPPAALTPLMPPVSPAPAPVAVPALPPGGAGVAGSGGSGGSANGSGGAAKWWRPKASDGLQFDYVLSVEFDPAADIEDGVQVYIIDLFDNSNATVAAIKARGFSPVCYLSAGAFERWRPDAKRFAESDKGLPLDGWEGERWLDVRSQGVREVVRKRLELCRNKGFVGVDPDYTEASLNDNGLGLTSEDQINYVIWLSEAAHDLGLAIGLKNNLGQVASLAPHVDFFVNEECVRYNECALYAPALAGDKPVWSVNYRRVDLKKACRCQSVFAVTSALKRVSLNAWRAGCPQPSDDGGGAGCAAPAAANASAVYQAHRRSHRPHRRAKRRGRTLLQLR